jgi:hypothetical protein
MPAPTTQTILPFEAILRRVDVAGLNPGSGSESYEAFCEWLSSHFIPSDRVLTSEYLTLIDKTARDVTSLIQHRSLICHDID